MSENNYVSSSKDYIKPITDSIQSFYKNGIGGSEGFEFGKLAVFNSFSLTIFLVGLGEMIWKIFRKKDIYN
ncbi:MAG: hypothetical protein WCJ58_01370 [bacterium]